MSLATIGLLMRLLIVVALAATFIVDYLAASNRERLIAVQREHLQEYERTIAAMNRTIESQEKNIALRKEKMGY